MPTLNIGGQSVQVDDSFLTLPPDQQSATVEEIAGSMPPQLPQLTQGRESPNRVYIGDRNAPQPASQQPSTPPSIGDKLANLWENPPAGPSFIGMAKSLYDTVATPGRAMQAATDYANKSEITDSDIPPSTSLFAAPAANMAANIMLPAPGMAGGLSLLPKGAPAPAYGVNDIQRKAAQIVTDPLKQAGITTPAAVESAAAKIGPEATLADIDPRLTQLAAQVAIRPSKGQQIMRSVMETRNASAPDRVLSDVNSTMGAPVNLLETRDNILQNAQAKAAPLWKQAYSVPIQSTPELDQALATPAGQYALKNARTLALNDPNGAPSAMFAKKGKGDSAAPSSVRGASATDKIGGQQRMTAAEYKALTNNQGTAPSVDVRGLHLVRQAFDDMIEKAKNPTTSLGKNALGALYTNRKVVDKALKQVEPMAQADNIFASGSKIRDAIRDGVDLFNNKLMPEDIAAKLATMPEAARAGYLQGARVAIRRAMGTARNEASKVRSMFHEGFNREKLDLVLGKEKADQLLQRVKAEDEYAKTDNVVLRNSQTAYKLAGKEALDDAHGFPDVLSTLNYSGAHAIPRHIILRGISHVIDAAKAGRQQAIETEVAKLLSMDRNGRAQIATALFQEGARSDPSGRLNAAILPFVLQHAVAGDDSVPRGIQTLRRSQAR